MEHTRQYKAAELKCITGLETNVVNAQVWFDLGEAYAHQGKGQAAKLAYTRAWILDPEAKWADTLFPTLSSIPKGEVPEALTSLLQVQKVSVAAAILVKNEARSILRCLQSISMAVDEIVVIDTGSTDGTIDIVNNFSHPNLQLIAHEWQDDFAEARNVGLAAIASDWVIWLDADEYLHEEDVAVVREAAGLYASLNEALILRPVVVNLLANHQTSTSYDTSRMFPTHAGLRFWGRIHEQIGSASGDATRFLRPAVRIRLYHDGYLPEIAAQKGKQQRNLRLLEKMVQDTPDDPAAWLFYGRETLMTGDLDAGIMRLQQAYQVGKNNLEFSRNAETLSWLIQAYIKNNQLQQAEEICQELIAVQPDYPDSWYYQAFIRANKIQSEIMAMNSDLTRMAELQATYRGIVSPDGLITDWKASVLKADLARFAGNLSLAQAIYLEVYQRHPEFDGVKKQLEAIEQQRQRLRQISFS